MSTFLNQNHYEAALILLELHGKSAKDIAQQQASELEAAGDWVAQAAWLNLVEAVDDLLQINVPIGNGQPLDARLRAAAGNPNDP